jgi:BioD-like phosphotransacetylase family protein
MNTILITSTRPYSGKSGISVALIRELEARGRDVGYFKPFGTMPQRVGDRVTDEDAYYVNSLLRRPGPEDAVCPVVKTRELLESCMAGARPDLRGTVADAFRRASEGRDVMVVEGPADVWEALTVELSVCQLATVLDARVLLLDRPVRNDFPDPVLGAADCLGDHLAGVVFNAVDASQADFVRAHVAGFLRSRGIPVFGLVPSDPVLSSVPVQEIVDALGGTVLSAEDKLDTPVESVMIGAMGQDKALRFFRRKSRKAVVTGGDRADVQLAALETDTSCIVLTGNFPPSSIVLSRAEELGVPMILVDTDTLTAIERMELLLGRVRLHDPQKADRIRELLRADVALEDLFEAFGVS